MKRRGRRRPRRSGGEGFAELEEGQRKGRESYYIPLMERGGKRRGGKIRKRKRPIGDFVLSVGGTSVQDGKIQGAGLGGLSLSQNENRVGETSSCRNNNSGGWENENATNYQASRLRRKRIRRRRHLL